MKYEYNPSGYDPDKAGMRPLPPAGSIALCEIMQDGTELKESSAGNPMLQLKLEVVDGVGAGSWLWHCIVLNNDWTNQNVGRLFAALGWPTDRAAALETKRMVGKRVSVKIKHENKDGETRAKIAYLIAKQGKLESPTGGEGEGGTITPPNRAESRPPASPAARNEQEPAAGEGDDTDSLPF